MSTSRFFKRDFFLDSNISIQSNLLKAKKNDQRAISELTSQFSDVLRAIAGSYFIYGGDTDDLYQISLIAFNDAIIKFDFSKNKDFLKFAKICVHNKIIDAIKESNRKKHSPLNNALDIDNVSPVNYVDPEKEFIIREQLNDIYSAIDIKLSDYEKEVLTLYIDGLSNKEIASRMQTTQKSIANAIYRIRNKLGNCPKS